MHHLAEHHDRRWILVSKSRSVWVLWCVCPNFVVVGSLGASSSGPLVRTHTHKTALALPVAEFTAFLFVLFAMRC